MAIECSICHLKQSGSTPGACLIVCMISSLEVSEISLTDWLTSCEWVVVFLVLSLTFVGSHQVLEMGPVTAAVTCVVCVSIGMCVVSVVVWGDAEEERFLSMAWSAVSRCFIQFTRLPSSCHRVIASIFLRSSLDYWVSLSLSLLGCSGGSRTIEADGCAWQNYWDVQPKYRWHSPLKSLPRWLVCQRESFFFSLLVTKLFAIIYFQSTTKGVWIRWQTMGKVGAYCHKYWLKLKTKCVLIHSQK